MASVGPGVQEARRGGKGVENQKMDNLIDRNVALVVLRALRKSKGKPVTDDEMRKLNGLYQEQIDIGAAELEAEGMLCIERTYTLEE